MRVPPELNPATGLQEFGVMGKGQDPIRYDPPPPTHPTTPTKISKNSFETHIIRKSVEKKKWGKIPSKNFRTHPLWS